MMIISGFLAALALEIFALRILNFLLFYDIVEEAECHVYTLFGKVVGVIKEPGLYFLWPQLGWRALIIGFFGKTYNLDMRMDQTYLRSQPVNSEEGAPMGIGVWFEMFINDPLSYLFRNTDPRGSLTANVSNSTVRTLSNLPLTKMLVDRHALSQTVRAEVSQKSQEWGYSLGSVYIRKVHFRDLNMIKEIEAKVTNRLKQVTASIKQDGENQVQIITNSAQRTAAAEFAKASAVRPNIVGKVLQEISADKSVAEALFEILETEKLIHSGGEIVLMPSKSDQMLTDLIVSQ